MAPQTPDEGLLALLPASRYGEAEVFALAAAGGAFRVGVDPRR